MKILLFSEYFPAHNQLDVRGGAELVTYYWALGLARLGHTVTVLATHEPHLPREQHMERVRVVRCGMTRTFTQSGSLLARMSFIVHALWQGRRIPAEIVTGMNFLGYLPAFFLGRMKRVFTVAVYHDVWMGTWIRHVGLLAGVFGEVYERIVIHLSWSMIFANSRITQNKLRAYKTLRSIPLAVIPNGVDLAACRRIREQQPKATQPTVCYVGRLVRYKHVEDLIHAVALVARTVPNIHCRIIGSGPFEHYLKEVARELRLQSNIHFLGFLPRHQDVMHEIARAHIFCLPSAVEGFGIVTIEAMAMGTPYVSSSIQATQEITDGGRGGILYPLGDVEKLAEGICRFLQDPAMHDRVRKEGLAFVEKYDWTAIVRKVESIYYKLIHSSGL